jgi:hypothetical protein
MTTGLRQRPTGAAAAAGATGAAGSTNPGSEPHRTGSEDTARRVIAKAKASIKRVLSDFDPNTYSGRDASSLFEDFSEISRMMETGCALVAPRIDASGVWKESGESSCTSFLASLKGGSRGQARSTLEVGRALMELPLCDKAAREGSLSQPKLVELTTALKADPDAEKVLLSGAESEPLWAIKERCQRVRATSKERDPLATTRRIRAGRHLTWWSDAEGAFCFQGRDTADRGAVMRSRLEDLAADLRRARIGGEQGSDTRESDGALRADALFALVSEDSRAEVSDGDAHSPVASTLSRDSKRANRGHSRAQHHEVFVDSPIVTRPPRCNVMVRVDLDALLQGQVHPGECCEIDGQGPIPVPMARDLANDSFLRVIFHQAGDIRAVCTLGRTISRRLRIALAARDRCCVVPGCGAASGLEIDHVIPFADGGPTELDNLALLCHHHHFLKTYERWVLSHIGTADDGTPEWSFTPQPPFGQEPDLGIDTDEGRDRWRRQQE